MRSGLGLLLAVVAALPVNGQETGISKSPLRMDVENRLEISGSLAEAKPPVRFRARTDQAHDIVFRFDVGALTVDAVYDLSARSILLDGHGETIQRDQIMALRALTREIGAHLRARGGRVGERWDMLHRLANFLSAAPAGLTIDAREIVAPREVGVELPLESTIGSLEGDVGTKACQVDSDDGIVYLAGGCSYLYYNSYHDASSHCWTNTPTYAGCRSSSDCLGRCGAGCGSSGGAGSYTTDCKDHDRCCRIHGGCTNPFATDCGDEYWDAADDFTFGGQNCSGCF